MKRSVFIFVSLLLVVCLGCMAGCDVTALLGGGKTPSGFHSGDLEKYVIICPDEEGYTELANKLADHIYAKYDIMLKTKLDAITSANQYQIVLGDTCLYEHQGRIMEYSVTVKDSVFQINAGGLFSAEKAVEYLCTKVFTGREVNLDNGEYFKKSYPEEVAVTRGTTARIMTANVLADAFNSDAAYKSVAYRAEIFAGILVMYTPDVLGLQETDEAWNRVLDTYLKKIQKTYGITYARHLATYEGKINYTSLLYRADKFKVEDSGVEVFTWWNDSAFKHNYHMRNITWAEFSSLENAEKKFIVANTHWSYRTEHDDGNKYLTGSTKPIATNELREQCKDETDAFMTELKQTHASMPIFLTGDFNTSLSFFTSTTGSWTPASFKIISEQAKSDGVATSIVSASGHYDHIFGTGNYTIKWYGYFKNTSANQQGLLTDHPFAFADLAF